MRKVGLFTVFFLICLTPIWCACVFGDAFEVNELPIGNRLIWTTVEENACSHFDVLRSTDGVVFSAIGQVDATGDSSEVSRYQFLDTGIGINRIFYKVQEVDTAGKKGQSHTVVVHRKTNNHFVLRSMSNTVTDRLLTVDLEALAPLSGRYTLLDSSEVARLTKNIALEKGENTLMVNLEGLAEGHYRLVFEIGAETEYVVIQKIAPSMLPQEPLVRGNKDY